MSESIYRAYHFTVDPLIPGVEILIAELGLVGFESFVESESGVTAYIQDSEWHDDILSDVHILSSDEFSISYSTERIEQVNWNAEWENNFDPILVDDRCMVRAPFHEKLNVEFDIIIEPKMSFGTGHHETTHMMIQHILQNDFNEKSVLDMGSGTGVLAILSEMKGAKHVEAIDIDKWCYENAVENAERNNCHNIEIFQGDAELLKGKSFDIIIANINRNILLNDIPTYASCLNNNSELYLSGFYVDDIPIIEKKCNAHMLKLVKKLERNNWVALKFIN